MDRLGESVLREDLVAPGARERGADRVLAVERVDVRPADQRVVAAVALEVLLTGPGVDPIEQPVVATAAGDCVVAGAAVDVVGARVAGDRVVAVAAHDAVDVGADVVVLARRAVVRDAVEAERQVLGAPGIVDDVAAATADVRVGA